MCKNYMFFFFTGLSLIPKPGSVNECPVCAKMFRKRQVLRQHLADIHKDKICNQTEDSDPFGLTVKSKKLKSDPLELIRCPFPFCKKVLASNSNLKKHLAVHKGKKNRHYSLNLLPFTTLLHKFVSKWNNRTMKFWNSSEKIWKILPSTLEFKY